ncbi:MAG: MBL fold metallo-hydrolase [Deltaproteobacteria bacterium]|nr:MBL fold metallo-hydrolase [Deltaproteobacteria bacterium]
MKKVFQVLLLTFVVFNLASCEFIAERTMKNALEEQQEQEQILSDGKMHVILVGTGGPLSNTERISTSTAVVAGGEFILVDVGPGVVRNINLQGLPINRISGLFLTHFHSDHISDLGELAFMSWAQGRTRKLDVYGPEGVEQVVEGYNLAYKLDSSYRTAHHGEDVMPSAAAGAVARTITVNNPDRAELFFDRNGLKAYVFMVDHSPVKPAVGYRFEYKGNVVVITGDTRKTPGLAGHAKNADLLLADALCARLINTFSKIAGENNRPRLSKIMADITDYHMTPVQAAEVAREAGVKKLVLVHVVPPILNFFAKRMYMDGVSDAFEGDIELGKDGMTFDFDPKSI